MSVQLEKKFSKTRTNKWVFGVGGGATSNMCKGRYVVRHEDGKLPFAVFIARSGQLSCSHEQAFVPCRIGDILVDMDGHLPADINNPGLSTNVYRLVEFNESTGVGKFDLLLSWAEATIKWPLPKDPDADLIDSLFPEQVFRAVSTYHNRDGTPFTRGLFDKNYAQKQAADVA